MPDVLSTPAIPAMCEDDIRPKPLLDEFFAHLRTDADKLARRRGEFVEVPCAFCGADPAPAAFEKDGFPYAECGTCGSLYCSPRPPAAMLTEWMGDSDAVRFWSTHFYRQTADARRQQIFRPRAAQVGEIAHRHCAGRHVTVADVGAGYGLFLSEVSRMSAVQRAVAIEPDGRLAAICRGQGFETVERFVEGIGDGEIEADIVTAFEVIEHVFDPVQFLASCGRLARRGGFVLVTTLSISGFDLQVLWDRSRSITPPQHLNFPTLRALDQAAMRAGLEVVETTTPGRLDVDIVRNRLLAEPDLPVPRLARSIALADDETRAAFQTGLQHARLSSHVHCLMRRP